MDLRKIKSKLLDIQKNIKKRNIIVVITFNVEKDTIVVNGVDYYNSEDVLQYLKKLKKYYKDIKIILNDIIEIEVEKPTFIDVNFFERCENILKT